MTPSLPHFGSGRGAPRSFSVRAAERVHSGANSHSQSVLVAGLVDRLAFSGQGVESPLQHWVQSRPASNLQEAIQQLSPAQQARLSAQIPSAALHELISLAAEPESGLFAQSLFHWAQRQEHADRLNAATLVYGLFSERTGGEGSAFLIAGVSDSLRRRASESLDAVLGRGAIGPRVEFLSRRLAVQATDPVMLVGMATGSAVFAGARATLLSRFVTSSGFLRNGFAARALASTGAFGLEVPAFWGTTKGLNELLHPGTQQWDTSTNLREIAGLGITLGALKLFGAASEGGIRLAHRPNALTGQATRLSGLAAVSQRVLPQVSMLAGILAGHRLETAFELRPHLDGATELIDGLGMLLQFNIGGRLTREAFPRLHHFDQELSVRSRALESSSGSFADFIRNLGAGMRLARPLEATAGPSGRRPGQAEGTDEARSLILQMSGEPTDKGAANPSAGEEVSCELPASPAVRAPSPLIARTGQARDAAGKIIDRFEPAISPARMLRLQLENARRESTDPQGEIFQAMGLQRSEIHKVNDKHFGRGLALALQARILEIQQFEQAAAPPAKFEDLPQQIRQAVVSADEMVGMAEYLRRSNQVEILEAFRNTLDPSTLEQYEGLKGTLIRYLGPHFDRPIEPHQGIMSYGSGDMMALLALYRHRVAPGELSWRTRLMVHARQQNVADEINQRGTYAEKLKGVQINYLHDPRIEAVGPEGYKGFAHRDLHRRFRLQILNVPSDKLHELLTREYIEGLPPQAILFEVIGGFIGKGNRGDHLQPGENERPTLLPYELIDLALAKYGRRDIRVVSGGGFIPGKMLWRGEAVEMVFAGPERNIDDPEYRPHDSPEARLVARTFASDNLENPGVTHHQRSTELGKAMKNVTSLLAGYEAGEVVRQMLAGAIQVHDLQGHYKNQIRDPLFGLMEGLLKFNEGFEEGKDKYRLEVRNDFWNCTEIDMREAETVFRDADRLPVNDPRILRDFINERIVNSPRLATTRNPKRGFAEAVIQHWRQKGSPYRTEELLPRGEDGKLLMTQEGINSLGPLMEYYNFRGHDMERRRLDDRLYDAYRIFFDKSPSIPPRIPEDLQLAMQGEIPPFGGETVRRALEGRPERSVRLLSEELGRFRDLVTHPDPQMVKSQLQQQYEVIAHLLDAMKEASPFRILRTPHQILREPYGNMFRIMLSRQGNRTDAERAFIRVNGKGIRERMTQLGMLLRSFPEGTRVQIEIEVTDLDPRKNFMERAELEFMVRTMLTAYRQARPKDEVEVILNNTKIAPEPFGRIQVDDSYFTALEPLVERLQAAAPSEKITAQMIRSVGSEHAALLDNLLQRSPAWPMLLGYFGGTINRGIKAALTRPERGTFIGIYSNGRLADTFMLYRSSENQPMALSHHLVSRMTAALQPTVQGSHPPSIDYFEGIPLQEFLRDYERYAALQGPSEVQYRILPLRSLPLEEALVDQVDGINAALLRIFLEGGENPIHRIARDAMLDELLPLYESPIDDVRPRLTGILQRYLEPFYRQFKEGIDRIAIFQYVDKNGPGSLRRLVREGDPK